MASRKQEYSVIALMLIAAAGAALYFLLPSSASDRATPLMGVVRTTQVHVAPEVGGHLAAIKVQKGAHVRAGDVVAALAAEAAKANEHRKYTELELARKSALARGANVSQQSLDIAQKEAASARA